MIEKIVTTIKKFNFKTLKEIIGIVANTNRIKLVFVKEYFFINK